MKLLKRPSLLLAVIVLCSSTLILFAQPFIIRYANSKQAQIELDYNQTVSSSNFSLDNAYTFYNNLDSYVLPMYIKYMQNIDQKNDYDCLLSNSADVPIEEKEQLHYLMQDLLNNFETTYGKMNYYICDNEQTHVYTNKEELSTIFSTKDITTQKKRWQILLSFNQDGIMSIVDYSHKGTELSLPSEKQVSESIKNTFGSLLINLQSTVDTSKAQFQSIKNTSFIFEFDDTMGLGSTYHYATSDNYTNTIINETYADVFVLLNMVIALIGFLLTKKLPNLKTCRAYKVAFRVPIELLCFGWLVVESICLHFDYANFSVFGASSPLAGCLFSLLYFGFISLSFSGTFSLVFFIEKASKEGVRTTYNACSIFHKNGALFKKSVEAACLYVLDLDFFHLTKLQLRLVFVAHTLILCFLWYLHIFFMILYGISLYFLWKRALRRHEQDYELLKNTVHRFSIGEYEEPVSESLGSYIGLKEDLKSLQEGIKIAIAQEVASQHMKNELITNVSHDLKTPLTSIISYIDLLKGDDISEADRDKYLHTLEKSADRLKHLIEDLFEISKANSGNLSVNLMEVDLVSLIKQVEMECQNAFQKKHLITKHLFSDEKILISIDPQKAYRIFENLISNVGKYALEKTRVFIQVTDYDSRVDIEIKNVSKAELNFSAEEIMERFTRGDKSRNTEGSGLGLAIAKSFAELLQGTMRIELDGDIFKVMISFYKRTTDTEHE